ncbi:hypothetical protein ACLBV0_33245, partial [Pseudomonas aeruginosa]|uniref:hypothetical protein n=1 Tax=Pseudomonas aeruginosa TaxID=287 RepID=UPI00396A6ABC
FSRQNSLYWVSFRSAATGHQLLDLGKDFLLVHYALPLQQVEPCSVAFALGRLFQSTCAEYLAVNGSGSQ